MITWQKKEKMHLYSFYCLNINMNGGCMCVTQPSRHVTLELWTPSQPVWLNIATLAVFWLSILQVVSPWCPIKPEPRTIQEALLWATFKMATASFPLPSPAQAWSQPTLDAAEEDDSLSHVAAMIFPSLGSHSRVSSNRLNPCCSQLWNSPQSTSLIVCFVK